MGTWDAAIESNDTFLDVYSAFFELYNKGQSPVYAFGQVMKMFSDDFEDEDSANNALFAVALAQWETKSQNTELLNRVKDVIVTGKDLEVWTNLGAGEELLEERKAALDQFLLKISTPKEKAKRRVKEKFVFTAVELIKITSPDGLKTFSMSEEYTNGNYIHTSSSLNWKNGGGSILYFNELGKNITARWIDNQTLEIVHDSDIRFTLKRNDSAYYNDLVNVIYVPVGDKPAPPPLLVY